MEREDLEKIGTEEARSERKAQQILAKEDNERIIRKEAKNFRKVYDAATNWAPYNWVMTTVDFGGITGVSACMRLMYEYLWGYFKTYDRSVNILRQYIADNNDPADLPKEVRELLTQDMPLEMCEKALGQITEAARKRAKLKRYGVEVKKQGLIKGNGEL